MSTGETILGLAREHLGERYMFGCLAPKNNGSWNGPWDCAELASWLVYQVQGVLYGCSSNTAPPGVADAWTGFWHRDAQSVGRVIETAVAARTPGAMILRIAAPGAMGHIVISDGYGGTVEAQSTARGVIKGSLRGRRWDYGVLVPGIAYATRAEQVEIEPPRTVVWRLAVPFMKGNEVRRIQRALQRHGIDPGGVDGAYGFSTFAAVVSFQALSRLEIDGEVGRRTARALGVTLARV